jgi:hypothetical protein
MLSACVGELKKTIITAENSFKLSLCRSFIHKILYWYLYIYSYILHLFGFKFNDICYKCGFKTVEYGVNVSYQNLVTVLSTVAIKLISSL